MQAQSRLTWFSLWEDSRCTLICVPQKKYLFVELQIRYLFMGFKIGYLFMELHALKDMMSASEG